MKWWDSLLSAMRGKHKPVRIALAGRAVGSAIARGAISVKAWIVAFINGGGRLP